MKPADEIERAITELRTTTTPELDARILKDALAALETGQTGEPGPADMSRCEGMQSRERPWRLLMKSKWTKLALAAAAIAVVATVSLTTLHKSVPIAYALDQTVEANRGLRYVHVVVTPLKFDQMSEAWVQMDQDGALLHLKMDFQDTKDGPKVVTWSSDNTAKVWFKKKKGVGILRDPKIVARIPTMMAMFDPKLVIEGLYKRQASGEVAIETKLPVTDGEPIVLTSINLPGRGFRNIYTVDPQTKLLTRVQMYTLEKDGYQLHSTWDYLDYNAEPAPETFELGAPADVEVVDETKQIIGLPKGDLSDAEITAKIVREYFEALIAGDLVKAGQLLSGVSAAKLQEVMEMPRTKFLRIVSIGTPEVQPEKGVGGMQVDCQIEIEQDGVKSVKQYKVAVRPVYSQRQNWTIHGI